MRSLLIGSFAFFGLLVACSGSDGTTHSGSDAGTDSAPACAATGSGTVVVNVVGLPATVKAKVTLTGPSGSELVEATQTLSSQAAGNYTATAARVIGPDPIVRTVYDASIDRTTVCVGSATTETITVTYTAIPTSNKLWVNAAQGSTDAFASASLAASGSPAASVVAGTNVTGEIAFDRDGNMWSLGATTTDPLLRRFPAGSMGASGMKAADREINIPSLGCFPRASGLAFDASGNLWIATCEAKVFKIAAASLAMSGDVMPTVSVQTGTDPNAGAGGVAFDKAGNLWTSEPASGVIERFDAASLVAGATTPSATLTAGTMAGSLKGGWLAFDAAGNLWSNDFGGNAVFKVASTDLTGSGAKMVTPGVVLTLQVTALLEGMAFDEGGGMWIAYDAGKFARIDPSQMGASTDAGMPTIPMTVVSSADVTNALNPAFFPAPAALPLYDALP